MRPSLWSIGLLMVALGGASLLIAGAQGVRPTVSAGIDAAALAVGGIALFTRRPFAFYVAIAGALVCIGFACASFALHRIVGLPLPPIVAAVAGLYMIFRVMLARRALAPIAPVTDDDEPPAAA